MEMWSETFSSVTLDEIHDVTFEIKSLIKEYFPLAMFIMLNAHFLSLWMKSVNIHARGEERSLPVSRV